MPLKNSDENNPEDKSMDDTIPLPLEIKEKTEEFSSFDNFDAHYSNSNYPELTIQEERDIYRKIEHCLFHSFHDLSAIGDFVDHVIIFLEDIEKGNDHPKRAFAMHEEAFKSEPGIPSAWDLRKVKLPAFISRLKELSNNVDEAWFKCSSDENLVPFLDPNCQTTPIIIENDSDGLLTMSICKDFVFPLETIEVLNKYIESKIALSRSITMVPFDLSFLEDLCSYLLEHLEEYKNLLNEYLNFKAELARNSDITEGIAQQNEHFLFNFNSVFCSVRLFPGNLWDLQKKLVKLIRIVSEERDRVIVCSQGLVKMIISKYYGLDKSAGISSQDMFCEGRAGLMKAMQTFDYRKGYRFSTYALKWVSHHVHIYLALMGHAIKLPVHDRKIIIQMKQFWTKFMEQKSREPTIEEIALSLKIPVDRISALMAGIMSSVSMEMPVNENGAGGGSEGEKTLKEVVQDMNSVSPDAAAEKVDNIAIIRGIWRNNLSPREHDFLAYAYGAFGYPKLNLEQIGKRYDLTRERIRQIIADAEKKMRRAMGQIERHHNIDLGSFSLISMTPPDENSNPPMEPPTVD